MRNLDKAKVSCPVPQILQREDSGILDQLYSKRAKPEESPLSAPDYRLSSVQTATAYVQKNEYYLNVLLSFPFNRKA